MCSGVRKSAAVIWTLPLCSLNSLLWANPKSVAIHVWKRGGGRGAVNWSQLNVQKYAGLDLELWSGWWKEGRRQCGLLWAFTHLHLRCRPVWREAGVQRVKWWLLSHRGWSVRVKGGAEKGCLSVDFWQVLVVPIEIAASVEPILGAGVWVGAQLKPPKWHKRRLKISRIDKLYRFFIYLEHFLFQSRIYSLCFWS